MNIIDALGEALDNRDWKIVARVFAYLEDTANQPRTNTEIVTNGTVWLAPEPEVVAEEQPKKKRGRPKKIREVVEPQSRPEFEHKEEMIVNPSNSLETMFSANFGQQQRVEGQPRAARLESFRAPTGPNKFDPNITTSEDPNIKVNDNVTPIPRTRNKVEAISKEVYCADCQTSVCVPTTSELLRENGRCEYATARRVQKCPFAASKRGG